mgnify:FL=1
MFRKIRKIKNEIDKDAVDSLLHSCRRGVLSMNGEDGYPYAIPVNYYYDEANQKIYFHGAKAGYKVDCLNSCDKVCFTVFGNESIKDLEWAPYVQSVVVFGRCRLVDTNNEVLKTFMMKYYPSVDLVDKVIKEDSKFVQMYEISIEHKSGKQAQEK